MEIADFLMEKVMPVTCTVMVIHCIGFFARAKANMARIIRHHAGEEIRYRWFGSELGIGVNLTKVLNFAKNNEYNEYQGVTEAKRKFLIHYRIFYGLFLLSFISLFLAFGFAAFYSG